MTRKEELEERVEKLASRFERIGESQAKYEIVEALLHVEREVLERVAERCRCIHNDGYTLDDVLGCGNEGDVITGASNDELRAIEKWARAQQKELA